MNFKGMFRDYKTMVVKPKKDYYKLYGKEVIMFNVLVYVALIGGGLVLNNLKKIKKEIRSKFNNSNKD